MPAASLQLEVTESLAAQDENTQLRLHELKALGIETAAQAEAVRAQHCAKGQGYFSTAGRCRRGPGGLARGTRGCLSICPADPTLTSAVFLWRTDEIARMMESLIKKGGLP